MGHGDMGRDLGEDGFDHVVPMTRRAAEAVKSLMEAPVGEIGQPGGGRTMTTSSSGRVGLQKAFLQSPCLATRLC